MEEVGPVPAQDLLCVIIPVHCSFFTVNQGFLSFGSGGAASRGVLGIPAQVGCKVSCETAVFVIKVDHASGSILSTLYELSLRILRWCYEEVLLLSQCCR